MKKNKVLNIETKIDLLINLNKAMIISKKKVYDISNFEKEFVKSQEKDVYYHSALYLTLIKEKNLLNKYEMDLDEETIKQLKVFNKCLEKFKLQYNMEKNYNEGAINSMNKNIEIMEIKDFSNSGIYYMDEKDTRKLIASNGNVSGRLNVFEKINILENIVNSILAGSFNGEKNALYDKIFSSIFDVNNISLEEDINALYLQMMASYYRPVKDMKLMKDIKDSLVKCTFIEKNTDAKVKYLINKRVCYM